MKERVMRYLGISKEKLVRKFETVDPFNQQNELKGYVVVKPDYRYGTIAITHINDAEAYQIQYGTPKMHYPFNRNQVINFPKASSIEAFEKLDGTNIFAYQYSLEGKKFQTYKVRLFPVMRNSKFGPFLDMWNELLEKRPQTAQICEVNNCGVSFEMYGRRNTHLVLYEEDLEAKILFGVDSNARVIHPLKLDNLGLPVTASLGKIDPKQDLAREYNQLRENFEKRNRKTEDEKIIGTEGAVWYLVTDEGGMRQFKCKPPSIEAEHWAIGGIDINVIKATAINVLETEDEITYQNTVDLLEEEFSEEQIRNSETRINKVVEELTAWYEFQEQVLEIYLPIGISIKEDKGAVMREMSKHFPRGQASQVYHAIIQSGK